MSRNGSKYDDISKSISIPTGCAIDAKGYVYANTSTTYNAATKATSHGKQLIGRAYFLDKDGNVLHGNEDLNGNRPTEMVPGKAYYLLYKLEELPDPPRMPTTVYIGLRSVVDKMSDEYELISTLTKAFTLEETSLILDLACYMLCEESAVFQHFPNWTRKRLLYSSTVRSDSYISEFLKKNLTVSKINLFKQLWATKHIGAGYVYLCYDSTNVNSQARGVFIVQDGHAKDDPSLPQVNTDYVIRQEDGLPLTFTTFPGSVVDIAEAKDMIKFIAPYANGKDIHITLICDRGYISEPNIHDMDEAGIGFLMMLRSDMTDSVNLINKYAKKIRERYEYRINEFDCYGMTVTGKLFGIGKTRYFHIIWDPTLSRKEETKLLSQIENTSKQLDKDIERKTRYTEDELERKFGFFDVTTEASGTLKVKSRGRCSKLKDEPAFVITGYQKNYKRIDKAIFECGFFVLVMSQKTTALEARIAYSKRDCVEKCFEALKSHLGMDKIGVASEESMHGKALIWFVASIIHAVFFNHLAPLTIKDKKHFTVPSAIDLVDSIYCDKNLLTERYERRYGLTRLQRMVFNQMSISDSDLNELLAVIS